MSASDAVAVGSGNLTKKIDFLLSLLAATSLLLVGLGHTQASEDKPQEEPPLKCADGEGIVMAGGYAGLAEGETAEAALDSFLNETYPSVSDETFSSKDSDGQGGTEQTEMRKNDDRAVAYAETTDKGSVLEAFAACESVIAGGGD